MHGKSLATNWPKTLWKIVTNPVVEVAAAIVAVLFATWIVVQTDLDTRKAVRAYDVPLVHK